MSTKGQVRSRRSSAIGLFALTLAAAALAPVFAPHSPDATPDPGSARDRPPGTTLLAVSLRDGRTLLADKAEAATDGGLTIVRGTTKQTVPGDALSRRQPAVHRLLLGSDHLGRDLFSRLLHGLRNSLAVALAAAGLALVLGAAVGCASAGDRWTMRAVDILMAVPKLFLILAVAATLQPRLGILIALLAVTGWMPITRVVRAQVLILRTEDFTQAARASGCSPLRIVIRHYLPHLSDSLLTLGVMRIGNLILLESALSFLGAGLPPPTASLGGMVADAAVLPAASWWTVVFPGVAIVLPCVGCAWVANRIADSHAIGS
jgi:peptide/nickel transport system permease protein